MKTIKELNEKWWYRLLKVIYLMFFIIVSLLTIFIIYDTKKPRSISDYRVSCNYGNHSSFYANRDAGMYITSYDLRDGLVSLYEHQKEQLREKCEITQEELNQKIKSIIDKTDDGKKLYDITKGEYVHGSNFDAFLSSVIGLLVVLLIFEVIRRIFYYIILGSFMFRKI